MQLKIVSDGRGLYTHIINADTGEKLRGVQRIEWVLEKPTGLATATMTLIKMPVEFTLDGDLVGERITIPASSRSASAVGDESDS